MGELRLKPQKRGSYRQVVNLYDIPESSTDSVGQPSQAPTLIGTFNMSVRPLKGDEILNTRQRWATATHIIESDWLGDSIPTSADNPNGLIMPQMVIKDLLDNSFLHVLFAENVEKRNRKWQIIAEEHVGATA